MLTDSSPSLRRADSAISIISPAPISSARLSARSSKIRRARSTATRATETGRSAIRVSVRTRLAVEKAVWNSRPRIGPQASHSTAAR